MVPLAIIAKTFGAKLTKDAKTNEFVLSGITASSGTTGTSGIDSDSGKSLIGDSYYKWSMNYPTGLVQGKQWSNGNWISFSDVKGDYYLALSIDEIDEVLDKEDKRDILRESMGDEEKVVDMKTITRSGGTFERIVTKDYDFFYEYRGIQANGYFYTIIFGKKAKSAADLDAHAGLLDSFKPSFNASNKALKDLARIINGNIKYENGEYGLSIELPKDWSEDTESTYPMFYGPDGSSLGLQVSSIKQGDTLDEMIKRKLQFYKDVMVEAYTKEPKVTEITWNGIPAILVEFSYSDDTKTWWSEYEVYTFKANYKYYVNYTYKTENKDDAKGILERILNGMKIDFSKVEKSLGEVPDPFDSIDLLATVTKTSKMNGFSISMPKYWTRANMDMDSANLIFSGYGMDLYLSVDQRISMDDYPEMIEKAYTANGGLKIDSKTNITFAGVNAIKYELSSTSIAATAIHSTTYLFAKGDKVYLLQGVMNDTKATELNKKQLEAALNSFQFTK